MLACDFWRKELLEALSLNFEGVSLAFIEGYISLFGDRSLILLF